MSPMQIEAIPSASHGGLWLLVILSWLVRVLVLAFWIVVAWRALRAHERIPKNFAESLRASGATK